MRAPILIYFNIRPQKINITIKIYLYSLQNKYL